MNVRIGGERPRFPDEPGAPGSVFSRLCEEHKLRPTSDEGDAIAAELLRLFQSGIKDETVLMIMLRARLNSRQERSAG
jgi:hypothetical protein